MSSMSSPPKAEKRLDVFLANRIVNECELELSLDSRVLSPKTTAQTTRLKRSEN